ncbi:alginate export family protein [Sphingomonas sp. BK235]|uniref:alginate export family protein n=1 Tax=Sphingomonas sp. BK235 TaxID=2512131 RepID=UPI001051F719|nr:alginate export family protein [Sphingomonas sp. BK235]TCP30083.1 alginate export protein [Sphingomonas sp. BK235]
MSLVLALWAGTANAQTSSGEAGAAAPTATDAWQSPTLTITRYDEHYDRLADPSARDDHWTEPFKYIPLGNGGAYLTTGIELRARNENYHENLWGGAAAPNDSYLWLRALPYADLHVGTGKVAARAFVQPILAYAVGVAPSAGPIDQTRADLLQGFMDVRIGADTNAPDGLGLTLRAGRQMLSLGTERLVGTRYGPNVPLTFDGFRGFASVKGATVTILAVRPVTPGLGTFDDTRSRAKSLWGAYATIPAIAPGVGLDLYYLGYRNTTAPFGGVTGRELRHSIGARSLGVVGDWHWNVEGVAQFGRYAGGTIAAWTLGTEVGRKFSTAPLTPDAVLRVNVVSGDRRASDGKLGTFNALFPKGKYFGELSPVGPTNIISVNPRVSATLSPTVTASLGGNAYWRYSRGDGVYDIPGNLIRAPGTASARFIGKEVEGTLGWQVTPELELSSSLSAFDAGGFIRQTGSARTIVMLGLEANFRF